MNVQSVCVSLIFAIDIYIYVYTAAERLQTQVMYMYIHAHVHIATVYTCTILSGIGVEKDLKAW